MSKKSNKQKKFGTNKLKGNVPSASKQVVPTSNNTPVNSTMISSGKFKIGEVGWIRYGDGITKVKISSIRKDYYMVDEILHVINIEDEKEFSSTDVYYDQFMRDPSPMVHSQMKNLLVSIFEMQNIVNNKLSDLSDRHKTIDNLRLNYMKLQDML